MTALPEVVVPLASSHVEAPNAITPKRKSAAKATTWYGPAQHLHPAAMLGSAMTLTLRNAALEALVRRTTHVAKVNAACRAQLADRQEYVLGPPHRHAHLRQALHLTSQQYRKRPKPSHLSTTIVGKFMAQMPAMCYQRHREQS